MHLKMLPIFKDLFIDPNPVPVKTALAWRGGREDERDRDDRADG